MNTTAWTAGGSWVDILAISSDPVPVHGAHRTIATWLQWAQLPPHATVLTVGDASGWVSREMKGVRPDLVMVGTDIDWRAVENARRVAASCDVPYQSIVYQVQDARNLDYRDGRFDAVWVGAVPAFVADPELILREAYRVLRPGGTLGAAPIYHDQDKQMPDELREEVLAVIPTVRFDRDERSWLDEYEQAGFRIHHSEAHRVRIPSDAEMREHARIVTEHLADAVDATELAGIRATLTRHYELLYRDNNDFTLYSIVDARKPVRAEPRPMVEQAD